MTATTNAPARLPLTGQRRRCVDLMSQGLTVDEIADELQVTRNSVKSHLRAAYEELGAKNGPHAVRICIERGILQVAP
jgi:DNA-binding CsgD family transcriptional regulator